MPQQQSPFLEGKYGWNFGESGWNTGMDENLLKFSYMFDRNVDGIVSSLPAAVNGQAYFLTTDNRLYFAVGNTWYSSPVPKWFEFKIRATGDVYQFNGTAAVQIESPAGIDARLDAVELTLSTLGTAAFEDVDFFATQVELDIVEASAAAYTDAKALPLETFNADLQNNTDSAKGARLIPWLGNITGAFSRWVGEKLSDDLSFKDFGIVGDGSDETMKLQAAFAAAAGKVLRAEPGKIYFTSDELLVPSDAQIDFCGSLLRYTIDVTGKSCVRFKNCRNSTVSNLDIEPIGSMTVAPNTGDSRMPVVIGQYDAHPSNAVCRNIRIENVRVVGGFAAMNAVAVFGRSENIVIENITVEGIAAPASAGIGVLVHWSADNVAAPTVTYHPRNIRITNPKFRKCALDATAEQASAIFLSGSYNVRVENIDADDVNTGIYVYPGDYGFTYSTDAAATQVRGIVIDGGSIANVRKFGVNVLGQANGAGPKLPMGVHVRNVRSDGSDCAFRTRRCAAGVLFAGCAAYGATQGILFSESEDAIAEKCEVENNAQQGVYFASSSRCQLLSSKVRGNNTAGLANQLGSAVYLDGACADNVIEGNHIGGTVATEYYGVRINGATVLNTRVSGNTFYNFTTNVAIQNDAAPYTAKTNGHGNVYVGDSLLANPVTPPILEIDAYGKYILRANAAPATGTWRVGDRVINSIPIVGQPKAWSCTVAGNPGTWVSEGNL